MMTMMPQATTNAALVTSQRPLGGRHFMDGIWLFEQDGVGLISAQVQQWAIAVNMRERGDTRDAAQ